MGDIGMRFIVYNKEGKYVGCSSNMKLIFKLLEKLGYCVTRKDA